LSTDIKSPLIGDSVETKTENGGGNADVGRDCAMSADANATLVVTTATATELCWLSTHIKSPLIGDSVETMTVNGGGNADVGRDCAMSADADATLVVTTATATELCWLSTDIKSPFVGDSVETTKVNEGNVNVEGDCAMSANTDATLVVPTATTTEHS
jgi:hypothetical protein